MHITDITTNNPQTHEVFSSKNPNPKPFKSLSVIFLIWSVPLERVCSCFISESQQFDLFLLVKAQLMTSNLRTVFLSFSALTCCILTQLTFSDSQCLGFVIAVFSWLLWEAPSVCFLDDLPHPFLFSFFPSILFLDDHITSKCSQISPSNTTSPISHQNVARGQGVK